MDSSMGKIISFSRQQDLLRFIITFTILYTYMTLTIAGFMNGSDSAAWITDMNKNRFCGYDILKTFDPEWFFMMEATT